MAPRVTVRVVGWTGRWTYRNHVPDLAVGDWVVVETPEGKPVIGRVETLTDPDHKAYKWLIDKIDVDRWKAVKALLEEREER